MIDESVLQRPEHTERMEDIRMLKGYTEERVRYL